MINPYLVRLDGIMSRDCFIQVVELSNWIPTTLTKATGMELEKLSWLGPFLGLSVFAEDNVSKGSFLTRQYYKLLDIFFESIRNRNVNYG